MTSVSTVLLVIAAALGITAVIVPIVRRLARGTGLYEQPVADRWHRTPVPKLGGIAMAAAFLCVVAPLGSDPVTRLVVAAPMLMFVLGVVDDLRPMRPAYKFAGQFAAAGAFLAVAPPVEITGLTALDLALSMLWFVGITNAFNLLDNIDGLAAGVATIAGVFLTASLLLSGNPGLGTLVWPVAAITGVAAGFLLYNWHPATIFMGDAGSYLLGSFFASSTLLAIPDLREGSNVGAAIAIVLLLVPCADTILVTLTRQLSGRSAFVGGRDHLSHRLVALGVDDRRAVAVLYIVAAGGGLAAIGLQTLTAPLAWALAAVYAAGVAAIGAYLGHVDVRSGAPPGRVLPLPTELTARYRVYEVLLDVALIALAYYVGLVTRFRESVTFDRFLAHFLDILPLVAVLHAAGLWAAGKYRLAPGSPARTVASTILKGAALGSGASVVAVLYLTRFEGYSRQAFAVAAVVVVIFLFGAQLALRALDELLRRRQTGPLAVVYGAGSRGALAVRELTHNPALGLAPWGLIDDDPACLGDMVEGVRVLGSLDTLSDLLATARGRVTTLILTIPSLPAARFERLCDICTRHGVEIQQLRFSLDEVDTDRRTRAGVIPFRG